MLCFYIHIIPSMINILVYNVAVMFVIDPILYNQELNKQDLIRKGGYTMLSAISYIVLGCFFTIIKRLQSKLFNQTKDYFNVLNMMDNGLILLSKKLNWDVIFSNKFAQKVINSRRKTKVSSELGKKINQKAYAGLNDGKLTLKNKYMIDNEVSDQLTNNSKKNSFEKIGDPAQNDEQLTKEDMEIKEFAILNMNLWDFPVNTSTQS